MKGEELIPFENYLTSAPVIPVLTLERSADAEPIATALVGGGLSVLEVTLRTSQALEAVALICKAVPNAIVGVGSVIEPYQFEEAARAGARFAVSPGATPELQAAVSSSGMFWMPAAQSVSEVLRLRHLGYRLLKFFPASASGGVPFLRSISGPVPDVLFCPTGGITEKSARGYLKLANVACVGGSWLTPAPLVANRNWEQIRELAQKARALRE